MICTGMQPTQRGRLQLSGRAGRQGDPGQTVTFCNLEQAKDIIASPLAYQMLFNKTGDLWQRASPASICWCLHWHVRTADLCKQQYLVSCTRTKLVGTHDKMARGHDI